MLHGPRQTILKPLQKYFSVTVVNNCLYSQDIDPLFMAALLLNLDEALKERVRTLAFRRHQSMRSFILTAIEYFIRNEVPVQDVAKS